MLNMHARSINTNKFMIFLDDLRRKRWADDIVLFADRLSVHRSKRVAARLEELSIPLVLNASYEPKYNPIENVFAQVKEHFKFLRLEGISTNSKEDIESNIRKSLNRVS